MHMYKLKDPKDETYESSYKEIYANQDSTQEEENGSSHLVYFMRFKGATAILFQCNTIS